MKKSWKVGKSKFVMNRSANTRVITEFPITEERCLHRSLHWPELNRLQKNVGSLVDLPIMQFKKNIASATPRRLFAALLVTPHHRSVFVSQWCCNSCWKASVSPFRALGSECATLSACLQSSGAGTTSISAAPCCLSWPPAFSSRTSST